MEEEVEDQSVAQREAIAARRSHVIWQQAVSEKARYIREAPTHHLVLHPTKGFRYISKRRLGEG